MSRRSVPIVFLLAAALSLAAVWGIFRIEDQKPPIRNVKVTPAFSPNGDGVKDNATIAFTVSKPTKAVVTIRTADGRYVASADKGTARGRTKVHWHGEDDKGKKVPDGSYRVRVELGDPGRTIDLPTSVRVDTKAPYLEDDGSIIVDSRRLTAMKVIRIEVRGLHDSNERKIKREFSSARSGGYISDQSVVEYETLRTIRSKHARQNLNWENFIISAKVEDGELSPATFRLVATDLAGNTRSFKPTNFRPPATIKAAAS